MATYDVPTPLEPRRAHRNRDEYLEVPDESDFSALAIKLMPRR
jgi:hypothetical protein